MQMFGPESSKMRQGDTGREGMGGEEHFALMNCPDETGLPSAFSVSMSPLACCCIDVKDYAKSNLLE
jgi:hypothetical protein